MASGPAVPAASSCGRAAALTCLGTAVVAAGRRHRRRRRAAAVARLGVRRAAVAVEEAPKTDEATIREDIRNIAIIAHVDHGKTTLTDALMRQTAKLDKLESMDSNDLEAERGITILAKNAAIRYKDVKINIIDTPGHADFGGEVERILNMADACLLLVDAQEGPMPQTKFVLRLAIKLRRKVIVCINKVDKPAARPEWVLDTTFDLFTALGADDELCDFPVVYASGFKGVASLDDPENLEEDLKPLLDLVLKECPKPEVVPTAPLQMLVSNLDYDDYVGRICIGRLTSGSLKMGQELGLQFGPGSEVRKATISKLWEFQNNTKEEVEHIEAGDICAFAGKGLDDVKIGDTVVDVQNPMALPPIMVEEPTVNMEFSINMSPFAGQHKDTKFVTGSQLQKRLEKEVMTNLALRVEQISSDSFRVKGRGILQLGILIENMRREGFEVMIGPPQVILGEDEDGKKTEPYEESVVDVPTEYQGAILEEFQKKGATVKGMEEGSIAGNMVLSFEIPTRNLIGMNGTLMRRTKGMAVLTSRFSHWGPYQGDGIRFRENGSMIASANGKVMKYNLQSFKNRGQFWVKEADPLFAGMVVGIHNKAMDIELNIAKEKATYNGRAQGSQAISVTPPLRMELDDFLGFMDSDERLEVTPGDIRLCKANSKGLKAK